MQIQSFSPARASQARSLPSAPQPTSGSLDSFQPLGGDGSFRGPRLILGAAGVGVSGAIGYGLGSAASMGGFGGAVVGGLTGAVSGLVIGAPMGNGKGAEGLLYPLAGAVVGLAGGVTLGWMGGNTATWASTVACGAAGASIAYGALH